MSRIAFAIPTQGPLWEAVSMVLIVLTDLAAPAVETYVVLPMDCAQMAIVCAMEQYVTMVPVHKVKRSFYLNGDRSNH